MPPMLGRAADRHGSCCGGPPGIDCADYSSTRRIQRKYEKRQWQREEAVVESTTVRIDVDFNERDGHDYVRAQVGDKRRTLLVGTSVVLVDPIDGIQTEGELKRIERGTGIAAFKVNWWGFEDIAQPDVAD